VISTETNGELSEPELSGFALSFFARAGFCDGA
jgi:hypothetical protein